eukprot:CAMPEP_0194251346 /NCGR_PEP_ID=MMETSP0158-20130606/25218_1 /TAXON_ID=33649 /ORGANISM="Thalassionema nitzschioides, Strain L26-B" /LENGTH=239 /DNA_ID=CAMNT_0038988459 /DNA_START=95 /DNA_END=814 /DNA_ORIENTATION=+
MRAWTCHGRTQKELIEKLQKAGIILSEKVAHVMEIVDRKHFCPLNPYQDAPQSIGLGQTISAPHMHAHVLEDILGSLEKSSSSQFEILDVGCGSGYLSACLGQWVHPPKPILGKFGKIYGIDVRSQLIEKCKKNIENFNPTLLRDGTVEISLGDGWKGIEKHEFDAIHVGAAADSFPHRLMMQLKVGGIMLIPIGPEQSVQVLYRIEKTRDAPLFDEKNFSIEKLLEVRYVPLIHPELP